MKMQLQKMINSRNKGPHRVTKTNNKNKEAFLETKMTEKIALLLIKDLTFC